MQYIEHPSYIHKLMYDIDRFYVDMSELEFNDKGALLSNHTYDDSFEELYHLFSTYGYVESIPTFSHIEYDKLETFEYDPKNLIVCISGGKDSLASVLHYQKLGYHITLFHLDKINRGYYGELDCVKELSQELNLPLVVQSVSIQGNHCWVEHPMKNMIIANLALTYGIANKLTTKIAFGNFYTSSVRDDSFEVCGGDDIEMWRAYEKIIRRIIPKFKVYISNKNANTTFNVLKDNFDLVDHTISCMTPYRFRNQFKLRTEKNYGVNLMRNRCGCCWKCAMEYIIFTDADKLPLNEKYYLHCIEILRYTLVKEQNFKTYDISTVWNQFMLYPMKKSKMREVLENAFIKSGEVRYIK